MTAPVVIEHLFKTYTRRRFIGKNVEKTVLHDVSLMLEEDHVLGLVGESGCGKSTLCKTLLGIEKPTAGTILANGKDVAKISKSEFKKLRRVMQVVYQDPYSSLDPRMNVRQLLSEPLDIHGLKKDRAERKAFLSELLKAVGLSESQLERYPHEFSGGQRQRINIARALALNPKILVADEPVSALDVSVQAQILNLLKEIKKNRRLSMLFVTHDFAVARFLCDDIAVMYKGCIVEKAPAEELFTNPQHPYTEALLSAVPSAEVVQKPFVPFEEHPERADWACPFASRCRYADKSCRQGDNALKEILPRHACACSVLPFKDKKSSAAV